VMVNHQTPVFHLRPKPALTWAVRWYNEKKKVAREGQTGIIVTHMATWGGELLLEGLAAWGGDLKASRTDLFGKRGRIGKVTSDLPELEAVPWKINSRSNKESGSSAQIYLRGFKT